MTNRDRLRRAMSDIDRVSQDDAISPTPYSHLLAALSEAQKASQFALDMNERDSVRAAS